MNNMLEILDILKWDTRGLWNTKEPGYKRLEYKRIAKNWNTKGTTARK